MVRPTEKLLTNESIEKAMLSAREVFLKRKHGSVHPAVVADYKPLHPIRLPRLCNKDAYGSLTDESTYSEYAWAFLRRNRFYQKFIDEGSHKFRFADWGYLSCADSNPSFGLARAKPYYESFHSPKSVKWNGIHTFQDRLKLARPGIQGMLDIERPRTQVALVFDIEALLGDNTSVALDKQISMATLHLNLLAEAAGLQRQTKSPTVGNGPDKMLLRGQLLVADLLSQRAGNSRITESDTRGLASMPTEEEDDDTNALQVTDIATRFLPDYLLNRRPRDGDKTSVTDLALASLGLGTNAGKIASKDRRVGRVSELARDAWNNIYNWRLLTLLQYDDWSHLVPRRPKRNSPPTD